MNNNTIITKINQSKKKAQNFHDKNEALLELG